MARQQPVRAGVAYLLPILMAFFASPAGAADVPRPQAQPGVSSPMVGREAPDFALHAAHGPNVRLSEHRGEVVVISFWGSHCGTCAAQLQALDRSYATFRSAGLDILGVNVDDDQRRAAEAAGGYTVKFHILPDPQ